MSDVRRVSSPPDHPVLIFDGDCGFCRLWIERWRGQTDQRVDFEPSQNPDISHRFSEITKEQFARAVQLIEVDGRVSEAAEAVFRLRALGGRRGLLWAYEHLPGVRRISERAYRVVADHRPLWARVTTLLWGPTVAPSTFARANWLFLRLLAIVYFIAFWSLGTQILGLVGSEGIEPAERYLADAGAVLGPDRFWLMPTLAWVNASDVALRALSFGGAALALLLVAGILPALVVPLLWLTYLSLSVVCADFLSYQWDALLLEAGFLAILLAPFTRWERPGRLVVPSRGAVWLMWWLLFRLMVGSGAVKLASGDSTWHDLTALTFHFETQPIPTALAWYAHQLPLWLLKASTIGVLAIEICVPFLILAPRRVRAFAFAPLVFLQAFIALTGNYAFFNLLTVALCLFLLDDVALGSWGRIRTARPQPGRTRLALIGVTAVTTVPVSVLAFATGLGLRPVDVPLVDPLANLVAPFRSVNRYGLFAVMTTTRPEIVLEGSEDGETWMEYEFRYKAGDLNRRPPWVAPHQPRLDWQMWFAALGQFEDEVWFQSFCVRLLEADRTVLALLERDPFEGRKPRYVRAALYRYKFSDATAKRREGIWWSRERLHEYSPRLSLAENSPR